MAAQSSPGCANISKQGFLQPHFKLRKTSDLRISPGPRSSFTFISLDQKTIALVTFAMCRPQKVHAYSCGHYVLDADGDACPLSPISSCNAGRREPCDPLLYELIANGRSGHLRYQGVDIMVIVYLSALSCVAPRRNPPAPPTPQSLPGTVPLGPYPSYLPSFHPQQQFSSTYQSHPPPNPGGYYSQPAIQPSYTTTPYNAQPHPMNSSGHGAPPPAVPGYGHRYTPGIGGYPQDPSSYHQGPYQPPQHGPGLQVPVWNAVNSGSSSGTPAKPPVPELSEGRRQWSRSSPRSFVV
ncbi:hypothetical protein B0H63DRAFT_558350 [Podospora didyma]|uniref:Uncharacterized protein n=1 Tax=Podospora didyma TaxID=330526 RepID=A0AAE0NS78_9PEZI|nr:hypothetical protein B0H63DRAFT_558350 [Podospora didyma]